MSPGSRTSSPTLDNEKSFRSSRNSRSRRSRAQSTDAASAKGPLLQDDDQGMTTLNTELLQMHLELPSGFSGLFTFSDGEEGHIPPPEPDQNMQDKLVSAWDTLQVRYISSIIFNEVFGSCDLLHCESYFLFVNTQA